MSFIIRYAIVVLSPHPMYGKDTTWEVFEFKDNAVSFAKVLSKREPNVCVIERRYASEENLKRGITFDDHIVWAAWLQ